MKNWIMLLCFIVLTLYSILVSANDEQYTFRYRVKKTIPKNNYTNTKFNWKKDCVLMYNHLKNKTQIPDLNDLSFPNNGNEYSDKEKGNAVKVANYYFQRIKDLCSPIKKDYKTPPGTQIDHIDTEFIKWAKDSSIHIDIADDDVNISLYQTIEVEKIEECKDDDSFNQAIKNNVNNLKNVLGSSEDWQSYFLYCAIAFNDARKKALRDWYCKYLENFPQDAYYKPVNGELQQYVFKNFNTLPNQEYGCEDAKLFLNMLGEDFGVCSIDNEDCEKRPWYVIGTFFDFISVGRFYIIESQNKDDLPLAKYLPKSAGEIGWKREYLAEDNYKESLDDSLKRWLELKFAYPEDEFDQLNTTKKLLDEIRSNLVKTKPYYRFLKHKIFPQPSESTNNSEELFLQSMVDMKHR